MQLIRGLINIPNLEHSVISIGNFDGVHLGHQRIIDTLLHLAEKYQAPSVLIVFEPTPAEFFMNEKAPARLMRLREKISALKDYDLDYVLVLRFNRALADLSAEDFVKNIVHGKLAAKALVLGDDFRFGAKRRGDYNLLQTLGRELGFTVEQMPEFKVAADRVSSTRIRQALQSGDLALGAECLGKLYSLSGRVAYGNQLGRQLGFPTANIHLHRKVVAISGIFVVQVRGLGDKVLHGVANVGTRPTVDNSSRVLLEVYIFDFNENIYGQYLTVDFLKKLRDEERYEDLETLKKQIELDVQEAKEFWLNI